MELSRKNVRAMIYYDFRRGLTRQQCIDQLNSTFGEEAPSFATVKRWYNEFYRGRPSLNDEYREGRPKSVVVPETIDAVQHMINQDRHVTYCEIETSLGISPTSIHKILHEHLAVKKVCCRWIPHNLTKVQKDARVDWCKKMIKKFKGGASKEVYKIVTGDGSMRMNQNANNSRRFGCFKMNRIQQKLFTLGAFQNKWLPVFLRKLVMWQQYLWKSVKQLTLNGIQPFGAVAFGEFRKTNKNCRIILHQDNASSHTSRDTTSYLDTQKIE